MRRLLTLLAALGFATSLLGCHHTCGICDCDRNNDPCNYYPACGCAVAPAPVPVPVAPTQLPASPGGSTMPKATDK